MVGNRAVKDHRARSQIAVDDPAAVRRWAKRLEITTIELQHAIDKVGNAVVAVRKQISFK
jgi:hypothetical protein